MILKGKAFLWVGKLNGKKESEREIYRQLDMLKMVGLSTKPGLYLTFIMATKLFSKLFILPFILYLKYKLYYKIVM